MEDKLTINQRADNILAFIDNLSMTDVNLVLHRVLEIVNQQPIKVNPLPSCPLCENHNSPVVSSSFVTCIE